MRLSLLGEFGCLTDAGDPVSLPSRRACALVAYLAINAAEPQPREKLADLLWCESSHPQAMTNLRKTLSRLRASPSDCLRRCVVIDGAHLSLARDDVDVDVIAFEAGAQLATPESLENALSLYRGDFLSGFANCGETFEDWLLAERHRLAEVARGAMQRLLDHYVATGAIERGIFVALRLLQLDPLDEASHRSLIRLYLYQDRVGAALRQYELCRDELEKHLGVAPSADTETLRDELLQLLPKGEAGALEPVTRETDDLPEKSRILTLAADKRARTRRELEACPSIAVLPFTDREDGDDWAHLCDGIAEDLIVELGRFPELSVIAPASAFAYRHSAAAADAIARELGVRYVLAGSIKPRDSGLTVTVRLIEAATGRQLWADRFDGMANDIAGVESQILERIIGVLIGKIEGAEFKRATLKKPVDWQAYDLTLQGWRKLRRIELPAIHEARRLFESAIEKDPRFARAHIGLAMTHLREWACYSWNYWFFPPDEALDHARAALDLDENDHRAHCMLGLVEIYNKDYDMARRHLARALEINPNDTDVLAHAAVSLAILGEPEAAVEAGRKALRLAPHHPEWYAAFAATALFAARQYREAIEVASTAPEAICDTPACLAASYAYLGRAEDASHYRDTVYRHYANQLKREWFGPNTGCIDWLLSMCPYRRPEDEAHYVEGLRKAGIE